MPEQIREAIWVRAPTSPLIRDLSQKQTFEINSIYTRTEAVPSDRAKSWQGTRDKRACQVTNSKRHQFAVRANRVSISCSIILCCNDAVQEANH